MRHMRTEYYARQQVENTVSLQNIIQDQHDPDDDGVGLAFYDRSEVEGAQKHMRDS